jgi:allantoinase
VTPADLVVSSTRVVTPEGVRPATVTIAGGVIQRVEPGADAPPGAEHVDAGDAVVFPGVVDVHVHVNEPGRTEWEGFATATRAAAAGGITTIVDMPLNSVPVTTTVAALRAKERAASGLAMVDYGFWGGVVPGNLEDLEPLAAAGVLGFKCFLVPSGIPEFAHVTEPDLTRAMRVLAKHHLPLLVHAELPGPIDRATRSVARLDPRSYDTYLASRPRKAELAAIDLVLRLCGETGCAVHVVHVSSADALVPLAAARRTGLAVTWETCPHYLTFAAEEIPDGATAFKCAPPIRERENRERLATALTAGLIDLVASDHSPSPPSLKCLDEGDFFQAWGGISSLQLLLPATWTATRKRGGTLVDLARWLAEAPAGLAGLARRKGRIAPGYDADFVIFDPDATFVVKRDTLYHRHPLTPYLDMTLRGVVRQTFLRGRPVYGNGEVAAKPHGRRLTREAA